MNNLDQYRSTAETPQTKPPEDEQVEIGEVINMMIAKLIELEKRIIIIEQSLSQPEKRIITV